MVRAAHSAMFSKRPWLLTVSCVVEEVIKSDRFRKSRSGRPEKTNIWESRYADYKGIDQEAVRAIVGRIE